MEVGLGKYLNGRPTLDEQFRLTVLAALLVTVQLALILDTYHKHGGFPGDADAYGTASRGSQVGCFSTGNAERTGKDNGFARERAVGVGVTLDQQRATRPRGGKNRTSNALQPTGDIQTGCLTGSQDDMRSRPRISQRIVRLERNIKIASDALQAIAALCVTRWPRPASNGSTVEPRGRERIEVISDQGTLKSNTIERRVADDSLTIQAGTQFRSDIVPNVNDADLADTGTIRVGSFDVDGVERKHIPPGCGEVT